MNRSLAGGIVLATLTLTGFAGSAGVPDNGHTLPMAFALVSEGPGDACAGKCRQMIAASGMITADTPRQFLAFVRDNPTQDATVVLESDGGSVLGALELGRAIRRLGYATTVGRVIERRIKGGNARLGEINPRVDCQSMCTFVLLGGVKRSVPPEARVLVHQIWLGDRREDAVAASYSAEDLVVVQRDIGSIVQYTMEMGGDIELVQLSLKAPPWEPMRVLSREELHRTHLDFVDDGGERPVTTRTAAGPSLADNRRPAPGERGWSFGDRGGQAVLTRLHPLTIDGERIGTFELELACGDGAGNYTLTYKEGRYGPADRDLPRSIARIELIMADQIQDLKISSSERQAPRGELDSIASITLPARVIRRFAGEGPASMMLSTESASAPQTNIRVGNVGFGKSFTRLESACQGQWAKVDRPGRLERAAGLKP